MPNKRRSSSRTIKNSRFSENWLVTFAMIFSVIGSYTALYALAAPEGADYNIIVTSTPHERAWFSSALGASTALLALGPILVFFLWWLWRRSSFIFLIKFLLTIAPLLLLMAVN